MKKAILLGIGLVSISGSAMAADTKAPGTCYIYVQASAPCHNAMLAGPEAARYYVVNAWFGDTEPLANLNAGRCLERAQEYKYWCEAPVPQGAVGDAKQQLSTVTAVFAFYQVNGINVIGAMANSENKTYLGDTVSRWLRWHD